MQTSISHQFTLQRTVGLVIIILVVLIACKTYSIRENYRDANALLHAQENIHERPFLKAHLHDGSVGILHDTWQVDTVEHIVTGPGTLYDYNRTAIHTGTLDIPLDSVAIFETNTIPQKTEKGRVTALAIVAGVDVVLGIVCLANPKACFGSCPTFYLGDGDYCRYSDAEGFSNAISPRLEYTDIDALHQQIVSNKHVTLTMKNEALETHCVNDVHLLAYPIEADQHIYHSPGDRFYLGASPLSPVFAHASEGDVTGLLCTADMQERFSLADPDNLSSKEEIVLHFANPGGADSLGFVATFRQTLMTTYFIYSAMGYMGDAVGDIFAKLESGTEINEKLRHGLKKELGNIDVYLWSERQQKWTLQGGHHETGPIAFNQQLLLLPPSTDSKISIKLVLNKGLWRLDYTGLTTISRRIMPAVIRPDSIETQDGICDASALAQINATDRYLISMPGDAYTFHFTLPMEAPHALFLSSKGYYLEWMRQSWMEEKDLLKLRQMLEKPAKYLRQEAPAYKEYEKTMEWEFWNSKIQTQSLTYAK